MSNLKVDRKNPKNIISTKAEKHLLQLPTVHVFERNNIENEFKTVLFKLWQDLSNKYCN